MSGTQKEIKMEKGRVDVCYTKRSMKGERESRCLIHKEKYKGRESGPCLSILCFRHLPDEGWSRHPKHPAVNNTRLFYYIYMLCLVG